MMLFLYCGQLLKRNFNPHVTARHHYTVAFIAYFFYIINAGTVFYLRDEVDALRAYLL